VAYPIERGKVFNFGAMVSDRSEDPSDRVWNGPWVKPVSSQEMYDDFAGWNEHVRDFIKVRNYQFCTSHYVHLVMLTRQLVEKPERWALHETLPLEYWTRGRITLLGDSASRNMMLLGQVFSSLNKYMQAHASLPFNGAGAGQAIEDAYVLGELLQLPECTREALPHFLLAYEGVRRPRATRQQISSRETGEVSLLAGGALLVVA
jgi:salicylate hydroxylase